MSHRGRVRFFARFMLDLISIIDHIFPRFVLPAMVFLLPAEEDRLSAEAWLATRS